MESQIARVCGVGGQNSCVSGYRFDVEALAIRRDSQWGLTINMKLIEH